MPGITSAGDSPRTSIKYSGILGGILGAVYAFLARFLFTVRVLLVHLFLTTYFRRAMMLS